MRQYLVVEGRTSRRDFWLFVLVVAAAVLAALFLDALFFSTPFVARPFLTLLVGAMHLVPFITASVRRLHDSDLSGWLYLLNALPFGQVIFIILASLPPTSGPNRYGDAPEAQPASASSPNDFHAAPREPEFGAASAMPHVGTVSTPPAQTPPPGTRVATLDANALDQLERLSSLRTSGVLTDDEFATLKAKLIPSAGAAT